MKRTKVYVDLRMVPALASLAGVRFWAMKSVSAAPHFAQKYQLGSATMPYA